jgi:putative flippase GtrA
MKEFWNKTWGAFAEKHPNGAKWVREGGLFVIVSNLITVFKMLLLIFLPGAFAFLGDKAFGFPGIEITMFGHTFPWYIIGYGPEEGGAAYFVAYMIAMFVFEVINFFIQKYVVFRNYEKPAKQGAVYFIAFCIITCIVNSINCIWKGGITYAIPANLAWLKEIGTTVLNGGVSMVVFFFVNKWIFPETKREVKAEN